MVGAMACYTLNDACVKAISDDLPFYQAMFLRGVGTVILLTLLTAALGQLTARIPRREWGLIALRSFAEAGAALCFLTALYNMPLSNATAILQSLPLSVALGAALFLREPIGWRRIVAILVGFGGVMLIVQPGGEGFSIYSLSALAAVGFVTLRDLSARRLGRDTPSMLVALFAAITVTTMFGIGAAVTPWAPVSLEAAGILGLALMFILGGYVLSVMVMRVGEIGVVAPFRYASLIFGMGLGIVLFCERPNGLTYLGAAIVVATGVFTLLRERAVRARQG